MLTVLFDFFISFSFSAFLSVSFLYLLNGLFVQSTIFFTFFYFGFLFLYFFLIDLLLLIVMSVKHNQHKWWGGRIRQLIKTTTSCFYWSVCKCGSSVSISRKKNFLIEIHSMQGWTDTARHGVTKKRSTKALKHTGNLF